MFFFNVWLNYIDASSGGSRISPRWGRQLPGGGGTTYDFAKISPKLNEIERIWTPGGRPKFYYIDPPLASDGQVEISLYLKQLRCHLISIHVACSNVISNYCSMVSNYRTGNGAREL